MGVVHDDADAHRRRLLALTTCSGSQLLVVRFRTSKVNGLRAVLVADGAHAQIVGSDLAEVTGSTPERVGLLAADEAIPVFESAWL